MKSGRQERDAQHRSKTWKSKKGETKNERKVACIYPISINDWRESPCNKHTTTEALPPSHPCSQPDTKKQQQNEKRRQTTPGKNIGKRRREPTRQATRQKATQIPRDKSKTLKIGERKRGRDGEKQR